MFGFGGGGAYTGQRRQRRAVDGMLLLLLWQLLGQIQRLPVKPPVTLGLVLLQVMLYLSDASHEAASAVCIHANTILQAGLGAPESIVRLAVCPFVHGNDYHLYNNMVR